MLNGTGLNDELRIKICAECTMTKTYLSNIIATKSGSHPKLDSSLMTFTEIWVLTTKDKIQGKLRNRGSTCMFVSYTDTHSRDLFRMFNLEAHGVINYRDVVCLKKMYED
jgi:hypothetical protein